MSAQPSVRLAECQTKLIEALHRSLTIACETGRTKGPEFEQVYALIRERNRINYEEFEFNGTPLTQECKAQLMGGG